MGRLSVRLSVSLTHCLLLVQHLPVDVESASKAAGLHRWDADCRFQNKSPAVSKGIKHKKDLKHILGSTDLLNSQERAT